MTAPNYPSNLPAVWDGLWGSVSQATGTPIMLGEWGGIWASEDGGGTATWQLTMAEYLIARGFGSFCAWHERPNAWPN